MRKMILLAGENGQNDTPESKRFFVKFKYFVLRKAVSKFNRFLQVFFVGDMVLVVFNFVVLEVFVVCFVLNVVLGPGPVFLPY